MTQDTPSPLPWTRGQLGNLRIYAADTHGPDSGVVAQVIVGPHATTNAALIVRAVNSYAAMKEALKPFAKLASHYPEHVADYVQVGTNNRFLTVGDLRRARQGAPPMTTREQKLIEALRPFVQMERSIAADLHTAHNRGDAASDWMREDDRDLRKDWREACSHAREILASLSPDSVGTPPILASSTEDDGRLKSPCGGASAPSPPKPEVDDLINDIISWLHTKAEFAKWKSLCDQEHELEAALRSDDGWVKIPDDHWWKEGDEFRGRYDPHYWGHIMITHYRRASKEGK